MRNKNTKSLTVRILYALAFGLIAGFAAIVAREKLLAAGNTSLWTTIDHLLFADISAAGNEKAIGLFYIIGQLFVRALQVVIIPMVFTSITLAMVRISDSRKLGRISSKTIGFFFATTIIAILMASVVGIISYNAGLFHNTAADIAGSEGSTGANPLMILINAMPNNLFGAMTNNGGVLAIVVCAAALGLAINKIRDQISVIPALCEEVSNLLNVILTYIVNNFGPVAIFCLITRTFASYGVTYLKPALTYLLITTGMLLITLFLGYALFIKLTTGLNPMPFVRKIGKVALFGFSTSSSAATLPFNMKTTVNELGVSEEIASFVLPLGMTVNMDGTALMQVLAAIFIAGCSGYHVTIAELLVIGVLAIVASIGTPAAPGAGAVILFTILTGMGYTNEAALMAYSLILAINRPIEMLVTSLNVVGDSACAIAVAKSENALDTEKYYAEEAE